MKNPYTPQPGDYLTPDDWKFGESLRVDAFSFKDSSFPGCQFRLPAGCTGELLAVNLKVTGKDHYIGTYGMKPCPQYKCRVRIEFVGDGEPSTLTIGWLYHA